jgi:hypothetical protein
MPRSGPYGEPRYCRVREGPDIEEGEMYSIITAVSTDRIREWQEQAAVDRLVSEARRARRAAAAEARLRRRAGSARWTRRPAAERAPADATPDQWASALSMAGAAERSGVDDREPVGGRAS